MSDKTPNEFSLFNFKKRKVESDVSTYIIISNNFVCGNWQQNIDKYNNYIFFQDGCNSIKTTVTLDQPEVKEVKVTYQIVPVEKSNIGNISDLGDIESRPKQPILMVPKI